MEFGSTLAKSVPPNSPASQCDAVLGGTGPLAGSVELEPVLAALDGISTAPNTTGSSQCRSFRKAAAYVKLSAQTSASTVLGTSVSSLRFLEELTACA